MQPSARRAAVAGALLVMAASGCAVRLGDSEGYFGPTLFRYADVCRVQTDVTEVVQVGVLFGLGRQWGCSLGVVERLAAAPLETPPPHCAGSESQPDPWAALLPLPSHASPGRWRLSLFHLARHGAPPARFVKRSVLGGQIAFGDEARGLSVGFVSTTKLIPPPDAFCSLRFDASDPMSTRLRVWTRPVEGPLPVDEIVTEVTR